MKVEVRATGLKAMRQKRGLTQRKLPTTYALARTTSRRCRINSRQAGQLQQHVLKYFGCPFDDLFETVLIKPETGEERRLIAKT